MDLQKPPRQSPAFLVGWLALLPAMLLAADLADWQERMQPITPRSYVCRRTSAPIVIDGRLDDPAWAEAPWTEDFLDIQGTAKPKPRLRTRAKML